MTDQTLEGKVALVTGASRGIGRAIAERLAASGAKVLCIATRAENAQPVADACSAHTAGAEALGVDVSDYDAVTELVKKAVKEHGSLDILVNNAGITRDQILLRMSEEDFDRVIDVNLKGCWNFVRAGTRALMKSGGRIINVSSIVGITGNAGQANYAASKAGLFGLTKSVAKELGSRKVTCNAVAPGYIATDMTSDLTDEQKAALAGEIPLGRVGHPDEIARAVEYLAGPGGAYITGQTLVVDGGLSL